MNDRLRQVGERLDTVAQLDVVMRAMRGIAATHLRDVHSQLPGIRAYAATIGVAIGEVMTLLQTELQSKSKMKARDAELIIVLCAEQGFAGTFNEQILDALRRYRSNSGATEILLVGSRGAELTQDRNIDVLSTLAMATRVDAIPALANVLAEELYQQIANGDFRRISLAHAHYDASAKLNTLVRSLVPFDFSRFKIPARGEPPMLTLDPEDLVSRLAREYVYAELCDALMQSYAAENEARMRAMIRARTNVENTQKALSAEYQQLRQEQITSEITELSVGRLSERS